MRVDNISDLFDDVKEFASTKVIFPLLVAGTFFTGCGNEISGNIQFFDRRDNSGKITMKNLYNPKDVKRTEIAPSGDYYFKVHDGTWIKFVGMKTDSGYVLVRRDTVNIDGPKKSSETYFKIKVENKR